MTDRPIIFSAPMVRALLDGRKTQTRRVLKQKGAAKTRQYKHLRFDVLDGMLWWWDGDHDLVGASQAYPYSPGDRLWVREAWSARMTHGWTIADARSGFYETEMLYRADGEEGIDGWWPSIHMPREFSRLTLTVTDVRVQRLQDISNEDAKAEGVLGECAFHVGNDDTYRAPFRDLWNSLHGHGAWNDNPWVVALTFTVQHGNIDKVGQ